MAAPKIINIDTGPSTETGGELAALYNSKYETVRLQYPRDLNSTPKLHAVKFDAYAIDPVTYEQVTSAVVSAGTQVWNNPGETVATAYSSASGLTEEAKAALQTGDVGAIFNNTLKVVSKPTTLEKPGDSITLYMPETVNFSYNAQYDELSLSEAAQSVPLAGKVATAITSTIGNRAAGGNAAARLLLNTAGYVFNPQQQLLFEGIDFRTYNMTFTFTPYSKKESDEVARIIQSFRKNAAPSIVTQSAGFFFTPPSIFNVSFMFDGQINTSINQLKKSVLENVDVNYAPNGWSAHEDGSPVQITMSLSFKEIELVDRTAILQGF